MIAARTAAIYAELNGRSHLAGQLAVEAKDGFERAQWHPNAHWRHSAVARLLGPVIATSSSFRSLGGTSPLFGALGDSAPDRWGRTLMRRAERDRASTESRPPAILDELDFLLGVNDEVRAGNLRFARKIGGPFEGSARAPIPTLGALVHLHRAVAAHERDSVSDSQRELLLESGQLLGGSRPKASIRDNDGALLIAKFPSRNDEHDMQRWECLTLDLAMDCGIPVPAHRVVPVGGQHVLLLGRFDRNSDQQRLGFVSAMGLLGAQDNKSSSVIAWARCVAALSSSPRDDVLDVWRRLVFTILVSNKDNHLRNHGMVFDESGWRLAPAYDVNPEPQKIRPRELMLSIDGVDDRASLDAALAAAPLFGIDPPLARATARAIAERIATWRDRARSMRLSRKEIAKMSDAFEHEDAVRARTLSP